MEDTSSGSRDVRRQHQERYLAALRRPECKPLSHADERALHARLTAFRRTHKGSLTLEAVMECEAARELLEHHVWLVVSIAKRYVSDKHDLPDLVQEGAIGLARALCKFNPDRGYRFLTYAHYWVRQGVQEYVMENRFAFHVPAHRAKGLARLQRVLEAHPALEDAATYRAYRALRRQQGFEPATDLSAGQFERFRALRDDSRAWRRAEHPLSLEPQDGPDDGPQALQIPAADAAPDERMAQCELRAGLESLLGRLDPLDAEILRRRFCLGRPYGTLNEIGQHFGLTRERIRQRQARALRRLRELPEAGALADYASSPDAGRPYEAR